MKYAIPVRTNHAILTTLLALHGLVFFALPTLLAQSPFWGLIFVPLAWLNIVHWGLIHEAIHKLLVPSSRGNEWGGRALGIAMGTSFHVLRYGHLMHHQLNRQFHSDHVQKRTWLNRAWYYLHLVCGLYLSEVVAGWLILVLPRAAFLWLGRTTFMRDYPQGYQAGERFFYGRGNARYVRRDVFATLLIYSAAFYMYGAQWPWLIGFLAIRAFVISFMDNIYHFGTPADNSKAAKELALPQTISALILYGNFHETHHTNPDVPWRELPTIHAAQGRVFDGDFFEHGLRQFEGPGLAA